MSKVFSDFWKIIIVKNSKITIPVVVGIIIVAIGILAITSQESNVMEVENALDRELRPNEEITPEIQEKIDEVEKINLENEYSPKPREWITSGPFQIDRSEYAIGENVFIRINELDVNEKGQIAIMQPLNSTHKKVYLTIPFDGTDKPGANTYFSPQISKIKKICSIDNLTGNWTVVFRGTNYSNLEFKITEEILPGTNIESVC